MRALSPIVVFSHLRWNFVYQRPQHLLSRLAANRQVLFVEEPVYVEGAEPSWELERPEPSVLVCRPQTPLADHGFSDGQLAMLHQLLPLLLEKENVKECVAWFYTPMALPLRHALNARAVVFDVMDELSAVRNAPPRLLEREAELLSIADVVFTGGPSLYKAKKNRHPNVHCFPSSGHAAMRHPEMMKMAADLWTHDQAGGLFSG